MRIQIRAVGAAPERHDVVELVAACHDRIRRFCELAARLAAAPINTPFSELAESAAAVHRYFTVALPLHVADEELSIRPHVQDRLPEALAQMLREHVTIEQLVQDQLPVFAELAAHPDRIGALRARLQSAARALVVTLEPHLALEERTLFSEVAKLEPAQKTAIRQEMSARRAGQP